MESKFIGKEVIVRGEASGVFFGTLAARAGREAFCRDRGIDTSRDAFTILEFIDLTAESYGGDTVRKLAEMYKNNN